MTTATAARTTSPDGGHWYTTDGKPMYEVPSKTGAMRPTTLRDARKLNLLPSVTTILKVLHKQGLVDWMIEQAVLAALTTPRNEGEELDAFVHRVLHTERVQDQESQKARDRGTEIHNGIETILSGGKVSDDLLPWVKPVTDYLQAEFNEVISVERILIGDGYAGRTDLIALKDKTAWVLDFKTAKKLPLNSKSWDEHVLQLGAYAHAYCRQDRVDPNLIRTGNIYISTIEQGEFIVAPHEPDWVNVYIHGFHPLVKYWQWVNDYRPVL